MLTVALQALFGFAIGYVLASYIESFMHEHVSDARTKRVQIGRASCRERV